MVVTDGGMGSWIGIRIGFGIVQWLVICTGKTCMVFVDGSLISKRSDFWSV